MPERSTIGIVVAMEQEVSILRDRYFGGAASRDGLCPIYESSINGTPVVLAHSGIGKVNATIAASELVLRYRPSSLLVSGLAGSLSDALTAGDMVVATGAVHHDFDLTPLLRRRGQLPGLHGAELAASPRLVDAATEATAKVAADVAQRRRGGVVPRFLRGTVASGDALISSAARKEEILLHFPEALCVDMETAAVAQVAAAAGCEWAAVRVVSDNADESFDVGDVLSFINEEGAESISALLAGLCGL
ncbi:MAG: 5'-methylthioadenosine/adenosylhomocysteine nucleosidase [Actinomycetota bacterium]|nr:5'-methylthioadenosine/adenosylhomocysteine nucleosidase [Actinomycetota bacterium]